MIRTGSRGRSLVVAICASLSLLWATTGVALGASVPSAPGGTIYFYHPADPAGTYAVAADGTGLRAVPCAGDRTHGGPPRRVARIEPVGGTFVAYSGWTFREPERGYETLPIVRLVTTDEACGDVRVLWAPGPGYRMGEPRWSIDGARVALDAARYDAAGQMIEQGVWVGDVDAAGGVPGSFHLAVALPLTRVDPQPEGDLVAYAAQGVMLRWAPDGRRVTYTRSLDLGATTSIVVADLGPAGTSEPATERRVTVPGSTSQGYPVFSPVSGDDRIAFVQTTSTRGCYHNDLFITTSVGGTARQVTTTKNANICQLGRPDWSPDGRWIAFDGAPLSLAGIGIWRIAADGSGKAVAVALTPGALHYAAMWRR